MSKPLKWAGILVFFVEITYQTVSPKQFDEQLWGMLFSIGLMVMSLLFPKAK